MKYEIIDNFLPKSDFERIKNLAISQDIPYYFQSDINSLYKNTNNNSSYFTHMLFNFENELITSNYYNFFKILNNKLNVKTLIRMKLNLYPKSDKIEKHSKHKDYSYSHKGCILSLNNCDGGTILNDDTMIESVENRVLLFDPSLPHSSTTCTNAKARFNININYF